MDRLVAADSVIFAARDLPPAGTAQWATDGDPGTGTPATKWPAYFLNTLQDELIAILTAAGVAPDRNVSTQLRDAILRLVQLETGNYAPDTGADGAHYVINPSPAVPALTDGLELRFLAAHTNTGAAPGLIVSGLATAPIVRDDGSALVAGDIPANGIVVVEYNLAGNKFFLISTVQQNATALQAQGTNYQANDTGADGAHYVAAFAPVLAIHTAGAPLRIKAAHTNTAGGCTFNPGPGAIAIKDAAGNDPAAGMIKAGHIVELEYDGAVYQITGRAPATVAEMKAGTEGGNYLTPANKNADRFKSAQSGALATSMVYTVAHGLGAAPSTAVAVLACQVNDNGYLAGELLLAPGGQDTTTNRGVAIAWGAANVQAAIGSGGIAAVPKAGGAPNALTLANWTLYLVATL